MTIYYVPGKSSAVANALSHFFDLAAIIGSVEYSLLAQIHEAYAAISGNSWEQLKKAGSACEHDFIFYGGLLYYTCNGNKVSLVIPEDVGLRTGLLW